MSSGTHEDIAFGIHSVEKLLTHSGGRVRKILLQETRRGGRLDRLRARAEREGIETVVVAREELDQLASGGRHQGVVARIEPSESIDEKGFRLIVPSFGPEPFFLVLDGVQDPHNLGACLRSADAAGVNAVVAPKDRAVGVTGTVRKVAAGAAETVPFVRVANLARTLRWLRDRGVWLIGFSDDAETALYDTDLKGPLALVLGAEGGGLRRLTKELCDSLVRIPMHGSVESLNVSVAAGICLFEAVRQRERGQA